MLNLTNENKVMITEDYCSYEVAKLLKEKGFNESCYTYYDDIDDSINRFDKGLHFSNTSYPWGVPYDISKAKKYVVAPTLQMAMKWLRKIYGIDIIIEITNPKNRKYYCMTWDGNNNSYILDLFNTYEEAVEAVLKYSLENLV